jgi:deoxycytidylate deaminase
MGAVIAKGNKTLGFGFNTLKTHPKSPHNFNQIHAEFMAALNCNFDVKGATVYVFRQHKDGTWAKAAPCASCRKFLLECGIKEIVYSFEGHYKKEELQ